ncbi:MAG: hypothetical protein WC604_02515 [Candidatus Gracilibacteria bacterium]
MNKKTKTATALISALVIAAAVLVLVVVCKAEPLTEKERFIEANTEVTCEILKDPSISIDLDKSKTLSNKIFAEYDFPVEDNIAMLALLDKYENDAEILKAVQEKLSKECKIQE